MPRRRIILLSAALFLFATAARPCGPDFPSAVFVTSTGPDNHYELYAAGHLGIPQPGYRTRHLVIAYDYLTHRPLSEPEQKQAVDTDSYFAYPSEIEDIRKKTAPPSGLDTWNKAHAALGPIADDPDYTDIDVSHSVPGQDYSDFTNCLDDAFANAAKTLQTRSAAHGAKDPSVLDWVRAQDTVFSNCSDGKPTPFHGPGTPPPPPPAPHAPNPAPSNAPLWLKQDRAYQIAAAQFYALDLDNSITSFRAIADDSASPWSPIARYLIARCYIRKATLGFDRFATAQARTSAAEQTSKQTTYEQTLALAQKELRHLQTAETSDPRMAALHGSTEGLLDYVNARLQPAQQSLTLAARLHGPSTPRFGQSLIDLSLINTGVTLGPQAPQARPTQAGSQPTSAATDMLAWISAFSSNNETVSLQHFHATHSTPWLLAAISFAQPSDAATPELIAAAKPIPPTDPGYTAITYQRLRLQPQNLATRAELLTLIPRIAKDQNTSTINLFTALNAATAPTLNDWLAAAPRSPAAETSYNNELRAVPPDDPTAANTSVVSTPPFVEDVCGKHLPANTALALFDTDAANALNRNFPLSLLATAAESTTLPENLRFQVAQAAWARALLLDSDGTNATYQAIARRMEPVLLACRATWKPVFDAWNVASTPEARHAAALLALMRFASTEPSVRNGEERRNGFATYDEFRQNWWCTTVPNPGGTVDDQTDLAAPSSPTASSSVRVGTQNVDRPPLFLTPSDLTTAHTEITALEKIPNASTYFAQQALAWAKLHPKDTTTPDILGEADRVLRNSCRKDPPYDQKTGQQIANPNDMTLTANLAHAVFTVLHRDYPNSPWTKRYKSWQ